MPASSSTHRTRRAGTSIYYRLDNDHVARLITDSIHNAEHAGPGVPDHHQPDTAQGEVAILPRQTAT